MDAKKEYGGGKLPQRDEPARAWSGCRRSNGPYGRVLRPSDGKIPRSIAYVQCAGSRDRSIGVPYCSRVCCMYALKQALLLTHYIHGVEVTIYYMDIRAFGKGFEQFYRRAVKRGSRRSRARSPGSPRRTNQDLIAARRAARQGGRVEERRHDLVVLSQGLVPAGTSRGSSPCEEAEDGFLLTPDPKLSPSHTTVEGVFVAGVAAGPKDIPDAIVEAGEAAMAPPTTSSADGLGDAARARCRSCGSGDATVQALRGATMSETRRPRSRRRARTRSRPCASATAG